MADIDQDPRVAELLNDAGHEATRFIHPAGVQAVRTTVRHRRRNRAVGLAAALAIAVVGIPVAAVNLAGAHTKNQTPATVTTPTVAPTTAPASTEAPGNTAPDGKISASTLRSATLTIPAWPTKGFDTSCPSGKVHLSGILKLEGNPLYEDVDQDGAQETVAVVSCSPQGSDYKVLAFDRDAAGKIVTLGQVVASAGTAGKPGDILKIWGIQAGDAGQVRVDVGDYRPCCDEAQASQHQWRTYGWNGSAFTQVSGPTSFGPNPKVTDLRVSTDGLTMTKQPDGTWHGTATLTLHNVAGFVTPGKVMLSVGVPGTWQITASGCTLDKNVQPAECTLAAMAKGADRTVKLTFTAPAGTLDKQCQLWLYSINSGGAQYPAVNQNQGPTPVTVTTA